MEGKGRCNALQWMRDGFPSYVYLTASSPSFVSQQVAHGIKVEVEVGLLLVFTLGDTLGRRVGLEVGLTLGELDEVILG